MKKILIIILLLGLIGGGWYYYSEYMVEEITQNPSEKSLLKITETPVVSPVSSSQNNAIWYGSTNGRMMRYDLTTEKASEHPMPQIESKSFEKIYWPLSGSDFITSREVEDREEFSYFDAKNKTYTTLPKNILALDWMGNSSKIVVIWKSSDEKISLVASNPDATGYTIISELPWADVAIAASPTNNKVLVYRKRSTDPVNKLYLFDLDTKQYIEIVSSGRVTGALWSPKGDAVVYTRLVNDQHQVYYRLLASGVEEALGVASSIDRMAFDKSGEKLYVAALGEDNKQENIWEYRLPSLERVQVFTSDTLQVHNIIPIGQKLYFLGPDNSLYSYK